MKLIGALLIVVLGVVGSRTSSSIPSAQRTTTGDSVCAPIRNADSLLVPGRVILFGEMHGTREMPAFVGNVLCHAAKRHLAATLGVELASESSRNLDAFVRSRADSVTALNALLADTVWHEPAPDGRTSAAMSRLLQTVRGLVRSGADMRVVAFSRPPTRTRDSTMAVELFRTIARDTSRLVVVLTGNIHSRVVTGISFDSTLRPMGLLLRQMLQPRRVIGLDASYHAGTAWLCFSDGTPCGPHSLKGHEMIPAGGIELGPIERGYDGVYGVGAIVAAPPAVSARATPSRDR